jgi:outer membrane protein OmpA-like peptidoglycan-associated protein
MSTLAARASAAGLVHRLGSAAIFVALSACGAAPGGLDRVTLYQDGFAHFERHTSGDRLDLEVDADQVEDVIATLAVTEVGGEVVAIDPPEPVALEDGRVRLQVHAADGRSRPLNVAYDVIAPGWRASYRLTVQEDGQAHLDLLARVQNPTSEPWQDVRLVLGTRAPLLGTAAPIMHRLDVDGDGLGALDDRCPGEGEDIDGFEDEDGCPEEDNDGDRILDRDDACPAVPEVFNGREDEDGCPDRGMVLLIDEEVRILDALFFEPRSAMLRPRDAPILDAVAATLHGNPQILRIQVVGHTSPDEPDAWLLSAERAVAVRDALLSRGIDPARLLVSPAGASAPAGDRSDANRRVRFEILDVTPRAVVRSEAPTTVVARPTPPELRSFEIGDPVSLAAHGHADIVLWDLPVEATPALRYGDALEPPSMALSIRVERSYALLPGEAVVERAGLPPTTGTLHPIGDSGAAEIVLSPDPASTVTAVSSDEREPSRVIAVHGDRIELDDLWVTRTTYTIARSAEAPSTLRLHHARLVGSTPRALPPSAEVALDRVLLTVPLPERVTTVVIEEIVAERREVPVTSLSAAELSAYQRESDPEWSVPLERAARAATGLAASRDALEATRGALSELAIQIAALRATLRTSPARDRPGHRARLAEAAARVEALATEMVRHRASIDAQTDTLLESLIPPT